METDSPAADPADRSRLTHQDDLEATVEELRAELERRRKERRANLSTMPAETKQEAREVGLDTGSSEPLEADGTIVEVGHPGNFVGMTIGAVPREERGVGEPSKR